MLIDITRKLEKGIYVYRGDTEFCSKKYALRKTGIYAP